MRKDPEPWSKREERSAYNPRQAINLPSEAWIWEQPWQIEVGSTVGDADKEVPIFVPDKY